jgi:Flp pilus assembly protein TadG
MRLSLPVPAAGRRILEQLVGRRRRRLRSFVDESGGGVAIFMAVAAVPLFAIMGIATDTARAYIVKSRLSSALDAASLAGGQNFFADHRDDDIRMFFATNFPPNYLGATVDGPHISADVANEKVSVSATASVPATFMRLLGFEEVGVAAAAEVTRKMQALDVVLSIDISGSMNDPAPGGGRRIDAAKAAAYELIDILFGADSSKDLLSIGLVPWSSKVNVMIQGKPYVAGATTSIAVPSFHNPENGFAAQNRLWFANNSPVPLLTQPPSNWEGCVFSRYIHNGTNADDGDIRYGAYAGGGASWPGWQPIFPGTNAKWGGEPVSGYADCELAVSGEECAACPNVGITPLQHAKAAIRTAVGGLTATGNTNIPDGLGWAWRVLKPEPPFTEAVKDPPYVRDQAIVLLTDGENCGASGDGYKRVFGSCSGGRAGMNARLRLLAANVKADNVIVYVVQFANEGTALQTLLKGVASGPTAPYYHYAPSAAELKKVFREIANHLSELRLSK